MLLIFPLCVLLVYVVLAAQYESWSLPLSVILIVPMTLLSAIAGVWLTGGDNNVFTQISFLVLAGLACKNAILIVEFAQAARDGGRVARATAILDACRIRLRPILMTSMAFIMGVVPLVFSSGAGFEIRQAMGIAVFAGMLGVTLFGLFLTPVFYTVIGRLADALARRRACARRAADAAAGGGSLIVRTDAKSGLQLPAAERLAASALRRCQVAACAVRTRRTRRRRRAGDADAMRMPSAVRPSSRSIRAGGGSSTIPSSTQLEHARARGQPRRPHRRGAGRPGARGLRRRRRSTAIRR